MPVQIAQPACVGCGVCLSSCPTDVLRLDSVGKAYPAYPDDCQECFLCEFDCPVDAIFVTTRRFTEREMAEFCAMLAERSKAEAPAESTSGPPLARQS